jgi:hypothetical protein
MIPRVSIRSVEPTVFFIREGDALRQWVRLTVENRGPDVAARLEVRADGVDESLPLGTVSSGETVREVSLPDIRSPVDVMLGLWADGTLQDQTTVAWSPQRHWEVYLIQYAHHDLGYTDLPSNVLAEYDGFMDQVLRYCEGTEDWPEEEARFRYQCEQAWSVVHYVENRPPEVVERLAHYIRNGQIEVTALFGNQTLELCGHEELVRLLYPSFRLAREHGIAVSSAEHNDIPGFPWGLASVLAGAGVRYFSPGVPLWYFGRGEEKAHPLWDTEAALPLDMPAACWWEGPDGARVLLWSDLHGHEWQPYGFEQATSELPGMLSALVEGGYPYDVVSYTLRGGHRDNAPPTKRYAHVVREWNQRWAYPRLINATNTPFLKTFEVRWGSTLKTLRGDVPGTDYPVAATCTPKETAIDRNTHEWLSSAEKWATLASLVADHAYPRADLDRAYRDTFYYDLHCWGLSDVGGPGQDGHWSEKGNFAYRAAARAHDVWVKASNVIVDQIVYPEEAFYFTVFNSLSHERTDVVRVPLRAWRPCRSPMFWQAPGQEGGWPALVSGRAIGRRIVNPPASLLDRPFEIVDVDTGVRVPYQVSTLDDPQAARRWAPENVALGKVDPRHLREIVIVAETLPPLGYKTYQVVPCERWPAFARGAGTASARKVENRFYRVEIDPRNGPIASLFDVALGRELVDRDAAHGFGQLVIRSSETAKEETMRLTDVAVCEDGPLYTTVRLKGAASCCPRVTVEITLYHALKRIDLNARVLRDSTPMREVYLAFPFQVARSQFRFEATGSVIEPIRDQWPGSNTDAYAVQHWADVSDGEWGVVWTPVDTPMAEFGGLWPGYVSGAHHGVRSPGYGHPFLRPGELARGHIYALISYNNFRTNFINVHAGEYLVRYAFRAHEGDWRAGQAHRFGWNVTNPPLAIWMNGPQDGALPVAASFCHVDAPNVALLTFKRAEDGDGYVLRLIEMEGQDTAVTVTMPHLSIGCAFETNLVEGNQRPAACTPHSVRTTIKPFAMRTIRLLAE